MRTGRVLEGHSSAFCPFGEGHPWITAVAASFFICFPRCCPLSFPMDSASPCSLPLPRMAGRSLLEYRTLFLIALCGHVSGIYLLQWGPTPPHPLVTCSPSLLVTSIWLSLFAQWRKNLASSGTPLFLPGRLPPEENKSSLLLFHSTFWPLCFSGVVFELIFLEMDFIFFLKK